MASVFDTVDAQRAALLAIIRILADVAPFALDAGRLAAIFDGLGVAPLVPITAMLADLELAGVVQKTISTRYPSQTPMDHYSSSAALDPDSLIGAEWAAVFEVTDTIGRRP